MIPILAAASAIGTLSKIVDGAAAGLKQLTSPNHSSGKADATGPGSFAALLAAPLTSK